MIDSRWQYLKKYQGRSKDEMRDIEYDLKLMGFESSLEALIWFVDEFEKGNANRIYGCGPCCNDFIFPFIKKLEKLCNTDINNLVASRFCSLTTNEKYAILDSYNWFFIPNFSDDGREKIEKLEDLLSHTDFFRKIHSHRVAAEKEAELKKVKSSHLYAFAAEEERLVQKINKCREEILKYQSEIEALENQIKNNQRAKEREWELYRFDRLSLDEQIKFLNMHRRPLAYYEGRLSKLVDEYDFSLLSKELVEKLLTASKSAKPSKLPQVAKLHRILKQVCL